MTNSNREKPDLKTLIELFKEAGAKDPEGWAQSQFEEGINQLGRFSFLKNISSGWLKETDTDWVDNQIQYSYSHADDPGAQLPLTLKEMIDKNVSRETIIDLVRVIQFETLFHVCTTIDQTGETNTPVKYWGLYELDDDFNPVEAIGSIHESLLEFDPSEKEMRPR